jgi:hypothetical protein
MSDHHGLKEDPDLLVDTSAMMAMARGDPSDAIVMQEQRGGAALAASELLPTEMHPTDRAPWEALGFVFGDVVENDPLFRHVTLPPDWKKMQDPSDIYGRGVDVFDFRGIRRVSIFYKAASYDRKAHMSLLNVGNDVATGFIYSGTDANPVKEIPWHKLTEAEVLDCLAGLASYLDNAKTHPHIYGDRAPRVEAEYSRVHTWLRAQDDDAEADGNTGQWSSTGEWGEGAPIPTDTVTDQPTTSGGKPVDGRVNLWGHPHLDDSPWKCIGTYKNEESAKRAYRKRRDDYVTFDIRSVSMGAPPA